VRGAGQYLKRPPNASYFEAARVVNKLKEPHPIAREGDGARQSA
jgi:dihydropyrimidinase